jgi:hypothetical protein
MTTMVSEIGMREQQVEALEDVATEPACQKCPATVRLVRSIMDPTTGRSVRIFECDDCGQRT